MEKYAYYVGQARVLHMLGLSEKQVKLAFVEQGISPEYANGIYKEAVWPAIAAAAARGLLWAGRGLLRGGLGKLLGSGLKGFGKLRPLAKGIKPGSYLKDFGGYQNIMKGVKPGVGERIGTAFMSAGKGMETAPGKTLWEGLKQVPQGAMFSPHAKGIGGGIGKGLGAYWLGSALLGSGDSPQPQPMGPYGPYRNGP